MPLKINKLTIDREKDWDAFADKIGAGIYHYSAWRHLIKNIFGHENYYLYATNERAEIVGILPLIRLKSILFGDFMISMPYFNYGGPIAASSEAEDFLIAESEKLRSELGCSHTEIRDTKLRDIDWPVKTDKVCMLLDLPDNPESLWKAIGSKRRAQINRPVREGVEFLQGGEELLDDFYQVFSVNMRDLGTPVYNKQFFREIIHTFPDKIKIAVVRLKGEPVGAGFLMGHNGKLEIPWASTLRKVNNIGANMYLYWNILKLAIEAGFKVFDFGRSSKDAGTLKFKKQWGAQPLQSYWYYLLPADAQLPEMNPKNPKYTLAIKIWRKLPVFVTNSIGPLIVKGLP